MSDSKSGDNLSHEEAFRICDDLYQEALSMGTISSENIWDGFEAVLRVAKAMQGLEQVRGTQKIEDRQIQ